jgi:phosphoserine aminotransferase
VESRELVENNVCYRSEDGLKELLENLKEKGLIVGSGYGENKDNHIRIANFPSHTKENVERLIKELSV